MNILFTINILYLFCLFLLHRLAALFCKFDLVHLHCVKLEMTDMVKHLVA